MRWAAKHKGEEFCVFAFLTSPPFRNLHAAPTSTRTHHRIGHVTKPTSGYINGSTNTTPTTSTIQLHVLLRCRPSPRPLSQIRTPSHGNLPPISDPAVAAGSRFGRDGERGFGGRLRSPSSCCSDVAGGPDVGSGYDEAHNLC